MLHRGLGTTVGMKEKAINTEYDNPIMLGTPDHR
jgi:hypothetical protein